MESEPKSPKKNSSHDRISMPDIEGVKEYSPEIMERLKAENKISQQQAAEQIRDRLYQSQPSSEVRSSDNQIFNIEDARIIEGTIDGSFGKDTALLQRHEFFLETMSPEARESYESTIQASRDKINTLLEYADVGVRVDDIPIFITNTLAKNTRAEHRMNTDLAQRHILVGDTVHNYDTRFGHSVQHELMHSTTHSQVTIAESGLFTFQQGLMIDQSLVDKDYSFNPSRLREIIDELKYSLSPDWNDDFMSIFDSVEGVYQAPLVLNQENFPDVSVEELQYIIHECVVHRIISVSDLYKRLEHRLSQSNEDDLIPEELRRDIEFSLDKVSVRNKRDLDESVVEFLATISDSFITQDDQIQFNIDQFVYYQTAYDTNVQKLVDVFEVMNQTEQEEWVQILTRAEVIGDPQIISQYLQETYGYTCNIDDLLDMNIEGLADSIQK